MLETLPSEMVLYYSADGENWDGENNPYGRRNKY